MAKSSNEVTPQDIADLAVERARKWVAASAKYPDVYAAKLLSRVLQDPKGLDFTVAFVDKVIRPEDQNVAARVLNQLGKGRVNFLPAYLRYPFKLGAALAPIAPGPVLGIAKKVFTTAVGDLVLDVSENKLAKAIERLKKSGARLNMNLLGEAVLGDKEASKRLRDTHELLKRPDVDYVSLKVSAVTGPHNPWAYDKIVEKAVQELLPLYETANAASPKKFINLDMEEYKDLHKTVDVFKRILSTPGLEKLSGGIVLQTYLPDALPAMEDLQAWAAERVAKGGAPIKVRVVKGANLSMETVDSRVYQWPLVVHKSKQDTDSSYMRVLDYSLTKERAKNVRIGVAGMDLFTVAFGYELAKARGVFDVDGVEFEMLSGMASPQSRAVAEDTGHLLFYVPVVHPEEYDVAIAYLVRRLEENSAPQNFMHDIFDLDQKSVMDKQEKWFRDALDNIYEVPTTSFRTQNRLTETAEELEAHMKDEKGNWIFQNTPDSDPSLPANVEWSRKIMEKIPTSTLGKELADASRLSSVEQLNEVFETALKAQAEWAARPAAERADIIHRAGIMLGLRRAELMEVAASEAGKAIDGGDIEVSEAIDFCHYYAEQAKDLEAQQGAQFEPAKIVAVTPPWNFPVAIPCGGVVSALAAGSAVLFKPATEATRIGAVLAQALWDAGVPKELMHFVPVSERTLGRAMIADPRVDRVILTGGYSTAEMFKSWNPDLGLLAETSGKNGIIVTPSADLDLAAKDIVNSAFGHCGQKCSASSLAILVGSVGKSKRFYNQLLDGVKSLVVDFPSNVASETGALAKPAADKLLRGLTELGKGETWIVKPEKLDKEGKLWSPGVRGNVQPNSEYHLTEYFGPILGIIRCDTLEEALKIQNGTEYGLTAGLHSLDSEEINYWIDNIQAGNCYINRGITGAIVRRQPFGGWKRSAVGAGTKAGGPSYLFGLGDWKRDGLPATENVALQIPALKDASVLVKAYGKEQASFLKAGLGSLQQSYTEQWGKLHDPSQLEVERNILRYRPTPVLVRLSEGADEAELAYLVAAGLSVGSTVTVSTAAEPSAELAQYMRKHGVRFVVENDETFNSGSKKWAEGAGLDARIRLIGGCRRTLNHALGGNVDVAIWAGDVTANGRVEVIPFVHEQAISFTNHRFGNRTSLSQEVNF